MALAFFLVAAPFLLALGITLPLIRFETLYFFDQTPSLIDVVRGLWTGGDAVLASAVALLSIVFPVAKLAVISAEALRRGAGSDRLSRLIPHLARWSLMDVLLVALVIVAAKTGGIAKAFSQPGLWFYLASALSAAAAHGLSARLSAGGRG